MKKVFLLGLWCFVIALSISVLYLRYIFSDFNQSVDHQRVDLLIEEIKSAEIYGEVVYDTYNQIYDEALERSYLGKFTYDLFGKIKECPCYTVASATSSTIINYSSNHLAENRYNIARILEEQVSQKECLNYILANFNYSYNKIGIGEAARFYYQKELNDLEQKELVGLLIMEKNPMIYNPKRSPERHTRKVAELMKNIK
ncbi:MAG: transglycosylase domain-containing protein [Bacteroidota bacterium]